MGKEQEMLKMKEDLNANTVIPVGYIISLVWAEVKFSNGVVVYFSGEPDHPFNAYGHTCISNKPNLNTFDDEMEDNGDLDTTDFHLVYDESIQEAIAYSVIRHMNTKIQFSDYTENYVKNHEFQQFIHSQRFKDYEAMFFGDKFQNHRFIIDTNSAVFKKYEQTYMSPDSGATLDGKPENIVTNSNLDTMTASASPSNGSTSGSLSDVGEVRPINYI